MAEKSIECLVRGVVQIDSLQELIPILQSYSCPHLKSSIFLIRDYEYYTTQTRSTLLKRDEYSLGIECISQDLLTNLEYRDKLTGLDPTSYLYQEGRSLIGSAIVRSRRQSIVLGNIDRFLSNFEASPRRSWEYFGFQIELLGGIKVSVLQPLQREGEGKLSANERSKTVIERVDLSPVCYVVEIKCSSSQSNVTLASEKVSTMAATLSSLVQLSDS